MSNTTFLSNETVEASDLNNIAIELGAAEFDYFPELSPPSAVSALNRITGDLVTAGILNSMNKCRPTYDSSSNAVVIDTGIIVFESGAKLRVTSPMGVSVEAVETAYIYAEYDADNNTIALKSAYTLPTDGDIVTIAKYELIDRKIIDLRQFSQAKVNLPVSGNTYTYSKALYVDGETKLIDSVDIGVPVNYVIAKSYSYRGDTDEYTTVAINPYSAGSFHPNTNTIINLNMEGTVLKIFGSSTFEKPSQILVEFIVI